MVEENDTTAVNSYLQALKERSAAKFALNLEKVSIGHALLQACLENSDAIGQIDAETGKAQTWGETISFVVGLCQAFNNTSFHPGDVILLILPNHYQTCLPLYAGLINGLIILPLDHTLGQKEIGYYVSLVKPKAIFCLKDKGDILKELVTEIGARIIILDDINQNIESFISKNVPTTDDTNKFIPPKFDLRTPAWFVGTSGTTGQPKVAIITHRNLWDAMPFYFPYFKKFPTPTKLAFLMSPPQWITGLAYYIGSVLMVFPRVQTSLILNPQICGEIFGKYRPSCLLISSPKLMELFHSGSCDMSSLQYITVGGSASNQELEKEFQERYPNTIYFPVYGMTELFGVILSMVSKGPFGNIGKEFLEDRFNYKIVNATTGEIVTQPNVVGELWVKDSSPFEGYYNNPEETRLLYSSDGYLKTGDLVYKDANGYYFFTERLKSMLKYKSSHVFPSEIEELLQKHPAVFQAAVTGIEDPEVGDLVTALVVVKKGCNVTSQELCDIVATELSDAKRLRGGVLFVEKIPITPSFKIDKRKIKEIAINSKDANCKLEK